MRYEFKCVDVQQVSSLLRLQACHQARRKDRYRIIDTTVSVFVLIRLMKLQNSYYGIVACMLGQSEQKHNAIIAPALV
jgi:hypothetical protein